ncbi:MAG: hypothetical protein N2491_00360 [Negativicutes bacterium]|nr:hypothetical protein [Negativicutes bacterium]
MNRKLPFLQAALLCEEVTSDSQGRYTIKNEFSQYTMGYSQPFTVFTIWRGAAEACGEMFQQKVEIIAPDGRVVAAGENDPFMLKDSTYRQVNRLLLDRVDFTHDGRYDLKIILSDTTGAIVTDYHLPITVV